MGNFSSQYLEEWTTRTKNTATARHVSSSLLSNDDDDDKNDRTPESKDIRWLPWDPRSPSKAIQRTPIQVERTPPAVHKSAYSPVGAMDVSDENDGFLIDELEEESPEKTDVHLGNDESCKLRQKISANETPVPLRSPLKVSTVRNIDSPVMLLRYKQIKGIRHKQLMRSFDN